MGIDPDPQDDLRLLGEALYADLKRLARGQRNRVVAGQTLQTTALVNEAYLRLARGARWSSREHFMNAAARAMRHILVDHARARLAAKRGDGSTARSLDEERDQEDLVILRGEPPERVMALHEALDKLAALAPRLVSVVECRYFAGYTEEQTAQFLGLTERTVRRDWVKARTWLYREIGES